MLPEGYSVEERFFFFPSLVVKVRDDSFCKQIVEEKESKKREVVLWLLTVLKDMVSFLQTSSTISFFVLC